jgi:hypothetical protein
VGTNDLWSGFFEHVSYCLYYGKSEGVLCKNGVHFDSFGNTAFSEGIWCSPFNKSQDAVCGIAAGRKMPDDLTLWTTEKVTGTDMHD